MQPESLSAPAGGGIRFRRRTQIQPVHVTPTGLRGQKDVLFPHVLPPWASLWRPLRGLSTLLNLAPKGVIWGLPHLL
jgi:hypothetical protein